MAAMRSSMCPKEPDISLARRTLKWKPVVALEDGTLRIERRVAGVTVYEHEMQVSGLLLPSETERNTFRFQTDVQSQTVHLSVASGLVEITLFKGS